MENINTFVDFLVEYGSIVLFIIVFLEYLNLPGLPSGIIMPAAGLLVAKTDVSFIFTLIMSVIAGLLGSWILYFLGSFFGTPTMKWLNKKFPKSQGTIDKANSYINKYGSKGVFVTRLIPVARTIISFGAGFVKLSFISFSIYSAFGIAIWNFVFILAGYLLGISIN